jgi:hypothetical protein
MTYGHFMILQATKIVSNQKYVLLTLQKMLKIPYKFLSPGEVLRLNESLIKNNEAVCWRTIFFKAGMQNPFLGYQNPFETCFITFQAYRPFFKFQNTYNF